MNNQTMDNSSKSPEAISIRSHNLEEFGSVHGVTCDAEGRVWFAHGDGGSLVCVDPRSGEIMKRIEVEGACSGTAFDGSHIWQITDANIVRVDPATGAVVQTVERPKDTHCSGMAWSNGTLWIGDYLNKKLVQLDIESGRVLKTLDSDRFVTGIEWIDGELWHGAWETREQPCGPSLRKLDHGSGEVLEELAMPDGWSVSGTGVDADGQIWCGGSHSGGLRAVRRPGS